LADLHFQFAEQFADDLPPDKEAAYWAAIETLVLIARKEIKHEKHLSMGSHQSDSAAPDNLPSGGGLGSAGSAISTGVPVPDLVGPGLIPMV